MSGGRRRAPSPSAEPSVATPLPAAGRASRSPAILNRGTRLALSLVLLTGAVVYAGGPRAILAPLASASLPWIVGSLVVATLDRALMVAKWAYLLRAQDQSLPLFEGLRIYCSAMLHGMVLPSTVGADALRIYHVVRRGLRSETVVASVVVERLQGFVASLLVGLAGFWVLDTQGLLDARFETMGKIGAAVVAAATALVILSMWERPFQAVVHALPARVARSRLVARLAGVQQSYVRFGARPGVLAVFFALTVCEQLVSIVYCWFTALAVGADVSLWFMAGVLPLTLLVSRLPISFDGLGVFEAVFIALMALGDIDPAQATSIALLGRILQTASWVPWSIAHSLETPGAPGPEPVAVEGD